MLVNNAGYSAWRPPGGINESFWDDMVDTNLRSALLSAQTGSEHLPEGGVILDVPGRCGDVDSGVLPQ